MDLEQTLFDDFFFALLCDYFFVDCLLLWILNNIFHPHYPFSIKIEILDIFIEKNLNYMLCCLIAVIFNQIIHNQFVHVEEMSM